MFSDPDKIVLGGLQLYPSENYIAKVYGLFDVKRDTSSSDLMSDGEKKGISKIIKKTLNIDIWLKGKNSRRDYFELNKILNRNGIKLQVYFEEIGWLETNIDIDTRIDDEDGIKIGVVATMFDPYLYGDEKSVELKVVKEGGIVIDNNPRQFPIVFNTTISGNRGVLVNDGMYTSYSYVTISGACSNISITNETTGEQMRINVELGSDDVLVIDSRLNTRGIYLNGKRRPDLNVGNSSWLTVPIGESVWKFDRTASSDNVSKHCKIGFREVFV